MEWFFVDGMSPDRTVQILEEYREKNPDLIRILSNPNKTVPYAMNIALRQVKGEYIVRLDAHAEYATNYFSKCIELLERTGADNVGGVIETKSRTPIGASIAKMLSTRFGVGDSQFRTNGQDGYVDTVPFGAFRREVFEKYGLYDERLTRNQDSELNYRIIHGGGKIYLSNEIKLAYYCRDSVKGIVKMALMNGKWNIITSKLCPGSMRLRHFIPCVFVLSLIGMPLLSLLIPTFWWLFALELLAYLLLDTVFSARTADSIKEFFVLLYLFPAFHISYGWGSIQGICKVLSKKY
jgi:glycosyltransferase involved in cell wall biosynthesis